MFTHSIKLRFSDTDATGTVSPGHLVDYLEEARRALFSPAGDADLASSAAVMARVEIDYIRPLALSAEVTVSLRVTHVGRSSFGLAGQFEQGAEVAARATAVMVAYDGARHRSRPLTPMERAALARWRGGSEP